MRLALAIFALWLVAAVTDYAFQEVPPPPRFEAVSNDISLVRCDRFPPYEPGEFFGYCLTKPVD